MSGTTEAIDWVEITKGCRMPPPGKRVLIVVKGHVVTANLSIFITDRWSWQSTGDESLDAFLHGGKFIKPTHWAWMPVGPVTATEPPC